MSERGRPQNKRSARANRLYSLDRDGRLRRRDGNYMEVRRRCCHDSVLLERAVCVSLTHWWCALQVKVMVMLENGQVVMPLMAVPAGDATDDGNAVVHCKQTCRTTDHTSPLVLTRPLSPPLLQSSQTEAFTCWGQQMHVGFADTVPPAKDIPEPPSSGEFIIARVSTCVRGVACLLGCCKCAPSADKCGSVVVVSAGLVAAHTTNRARHAAGRVACHGSHHGAPTLVPHGSLQLGGWPRHTCVKHPCHGCRRRGWRNRWCRRWWAHTRRHERWGRCRRCGHHVWSSAAREYGASLLCPGSQARIPFHGGRAAQPVLAHWRLLVPAPRRVWPAY